MHLRHSLFPLWSGLLLLLARSAVAAPAIDTVAEDLAPRISEAKRHPERFAVDVPHAIDLDKNGEWTSSKGTATWHYAVRIPSARSISFHAKRAILPASAVLTVRAGSVTHTYQAADLSHTSLWSRIDKGNMLEFELSVSEQQRNQAVLEIASLQAGFRDLDDTSASATDTLPFRIQALAGTTNAACVQNYACNITAQNSGPGRATVAVVIGNIGVCTGTLINNTAGDNLPYVLTARHCESGDNAPTPPSSDAISVYWHAQTSCGQTPLQSVFSASAVVQRGATTVAEQEDAWLILLNESPKVSDAYFAGFDVTGSTIVGGYTIHHAAARTQQYVEWFGQAFSSSAVYPQLGGGYTSHLWETVNQLGNIGPGASGSGLFDSQNRLVGSLSLGSATTDDSGWNVCPAASPIAPNGSNGVALFTRLAAVWNTTSDTSSHTGSTTFQSLLDPAHTGATTVDGAAAKSGVSFDASNHTPQINFTITLEWNAVGAQSCTASGGTPGDGWSGTLAAQGSQNVKETIAGAVTYLITCNFSDGHAAIARTLITWLPPTASVNFTQDKYRAWVTRPVHLSWNANRSPCTISGGTTSLTGLDASGSVDVTESAPGQVFYSISCGTGTDKAVSGSLGVTQYDNPSVDFKVNATDRRPNVGFFFTWDSGAETCTTTGGAPGDGWDNHLRARYGTYWAYTSQTGTFTYSVLCTSGSFTASAAITVTSRDVPPYAQLSVTPTLQSVGQYVRVSWKSNVGACSAHADGNGFGSDEGTADYTTLDPGTVQVQFECVAAGIAATPVSVTWVAKPVVSVALSNTSIERGKTFLLRWEASGMSGCTASGGGADGASWTGDPGFSGRKIVTATTTGTFTYSLACTGIVPGTSATSSETITVNAPAAPPPSTGGGSTTPGSGGGGGGGAFDYATILGLAVALAASNRRRRIGRASPSDPSTSSAADQVLPSVSGSVSSL